MLPSVANVGVVSRGRLHLGYSLQRVHRAIIEALVSIVSLVTAAYRSDGRWSARVGECRAALGRGIGRAKDSRRNVLDEGLDRGEGGADAREVGFGKTDTVLEGFPCLYSTQRRVLHPKEYGPTAPGLVHITHRVDECYKSHDGGEYGPVA